MENKSIKKTFNFNYLSVILIYVWAFGFLVLTPKIKEPASRMFPYTISILAIVLATVLLLKTYFNWGNKEELDFSGSGSALFMAVLLAVYIGAVELVGFYLATPFYMYSAMWVLGQRNKKLMITISLLMSLGVYVCFDLILGMQIPEGSFLPSLLK